MKNRTCGECKHFDKTVTCNDYAKCSCKEQLVYGFVSPKQQSCKHFEPKHKPTNGDRIRAMSDEKLAELITGIKCCAYCNYSLDDFGNCSSHPEMDCEEAILEWLKKEVEDE